MIVIIDACGVLNLYASGRFREILERAGYAWQLPRAVESESQTYRQPDPADPTQLIRVPIDLTVAFQTGLIQRCDCQTDAEVKLYVELTARLGDDGESMGLALAKCRGWSILSDDKKARRIAAELGVPTLSTIQVLQAWVQATSASVVEQAQVVQAIELYANYQPGRSHPAKSWWEHAKAGGNPP